MSTVIPLFSSSRVPRPLPLCRAQRAMKKAERGGEERAERSYTKPPPRHHILGHLSRDPPLGPRSLSKPPPSFDTTVSPRLLPYPRSFNRINSPPSYPPTISTVISPHASRMAAEDCRGADSSVVCSCRGCSCCCSYSKRAARPRCCRRASDFQHGKRIGFSGLSFPLPGLPSLPGEEGRLSGLTRSSRG